MYGKVRICGTLELKTGLHIGGSSAFSAIGAVDSPVVRDAYSNQPMIPGTSLKGKMRTLLSRAYDKKYPCMPDDDDIRLLRLFGSAKKGEVRQGRLIVSDLFLTNEAELRSLGLQTMTEVKFENGINRATAVANPRQIERAVRGSTFGMNLIYDIRDSSPDSTQALKEADEDMQTLADGFHLLTLDYLGGHGTRGYGKVCFKDIHLECAYGEVPEDKMKAWEKLLLNATEPA